MDKIIQAEESRAMERYLMYLRKSRMDTDYEEISLAETLSRHRVILESFCESQHLNVVEILEEVASGESLSARPQMLRLLELVNTGMYAGVVCMDIDRLSRGSSMESGYIMQVMQSNRCKIITPYKTYDLQNESDEQFTDMKMLFSRFEYKTINKRLVRGRNMSASEGKFMGSTAPYGYRIIKLPGEKGNTLVIESTEADIVRRIYDMYGLKNMGYNAIANYLNDMLIPSQTGNWGQTSIHNILTNEVYLGKIRWRREPSVRIVKEGMLTKKRTLNDDYELYEGRHEPIITREQWDRVLEVHASKGHTPTHRSKELHNPFVTLLRCSKCGSLLKRNVPAKYQKTEPWYRCPNRKCNCRAIKCSVLETEVVAAMNKWLENYIIEVEKHPTPQVNSSEESLKLVRGQIEQLEIQQDSICQFLEKGVYTIDMFNKRNAVLVKEIAQLQKKEALLLQQVSDGKQTADTANAIIPTTQHILDNYSSLSVEDKNKLWKIVLKKISAYRSPEGVLSLQIFPNLPHN